MLTLLHIENIALIEEADIHFHQGFNVLTGETGAGKSIVVDAISAVLGERTSRDLIRTGSKSALVHGIFDQINPALQEYLEEIAVPCTDELILQREIRGDGKNICRANGSLLTVTQLKEVGKNLLNIHGQHDGQQLLDPLSHLGYLDSFGKTGPLLSSFQEAYESLGKIRKEISQLQLSEGERERRMDTLTYQINELERAELSLGEDTALENRKEMLRNTGKMMEGIRNTGFSLFGDEESQGAISLLRMASQELRGLGKISSDMVEWAEKLTEFTSEAEDIGERVRELGREMEITPEELDEMESRLDVLYRLKKKYGNSVSEMIDYLEKCKKELEDISYADDRILQLEKKLAKELKLTKQKAKQLSDARKEAGEQLTQRVVDELRQLDMPKVQFSVEFTGKGGQFEMDETGMDQIQFLMSANLGESMKPIQKVASGGELARIMLAMKNVLATDDLIPSLVFDEVDAGVSGRAAQKVAEKMADVAKHKQVLCVTHLPQIAAMADSHMRVEKGEKDQRTFTHVAALERTGRREELARLIGGASVSEAILTSGEELLTQADAYKTQVKKPAKAKKQPAKSKAKRNTSTEEHEKEEI